MKKELPTVTIITVVFNAEKLIKKTIESVINQSYKNIEYIIIDGGSSDDTLNIIKKYENKINYLVSEKDRGIYDAMNKGIEASNGEWINFLNAGDSFYDNNVIKKIDFPSCHDMCFVYGDHVTIDVEGNKNYYNAYDFTLKNIAKYTTRVACHQAMFIKRDIIPKYNLKYHLKSELDQYFYFAKNNIKYKKVSFPVVYFLKGGIGTKMIINNTFERIIVIYKWIGFVEATYFSSKLLIGLVKIRLNKIKVFL